MPAGSRGWAVRKAGSAKATKVFPTQKAAISSARKSARTQGTELYVHGRDGKIRVRSSFGGDSHLPKG